MARALQWQAFSHTLFVVENTVVGSALNSFAYMPAHVARKTTSALFALMALAGCGTIGAPGCTADKSAPPFIASAQKASCSGNRNASMTVADYYFAEAEHTGDDKHYKTAVRFYERAAETRSGQTSIYVPGAGDVPGYTMPVTTGPTSYGLPEARAKLALIYYRGLGVKQDTDKACKLLASTLFSPVEDERMASDCFAISVKKASKKAG